MSWRDKGFLPNRFEGARPLLALEARVLPTRGSPVSVVVELEGLFSGLRPFFVLLSALNRLFDFIVSGVLFM